MKHTIVNEIEVSIERDQVIELRQGDKQLWEHGYIVSIFEMVLNDSLGLYILIRVNGYGDHAYPLAKLKEDNGTLYFYCGERP
jgi:hypothetical protein